MLCNICGDIIKRQALFNEKLCIDCENKDILRALNENGPGQI